MIFPKPGIKNYTFDADKEEKIMSSPLTIHLRLIDYNSNVLTSIGTLVKEIYQLKDNAIDPNNVQFIKVINYGSDVEQVVNIGSQTTGAGATSRDRRLFRRSYQAEMPVAADRRPFHGW